MCNIIIIISMNYIRKNGGGGKRMIDWSISITNLVI